MKPTYCPFCNLRLSAVAVARSACGSCGRSLPQSGTKVPDQRRAHAGADPRAAHGDAHLVNEKRRPPR